MKVFDDGCGGFGFFRSTEKMLKTYQVSISGLGVWHGSYNIRPRAYAPIIWEKEGKRESVLARFGLVPSWFRDNPYKSGWINARSETVEEKRIFSGPFKHKRALLPADFFLEFAINPSDDKHKVPIAFSSKSGELLTLGAIYDTWTDVEGKPLNTFCILTTEPNNLVAKYHSRMPLLLQDSDWSSWLDPEYDPVKLHRLLSPYPPELMRAYRVKQEIGNAKNDSPDLIEEQPPIPVLPSRPAWES